jgi:hypothetical protein
MSASTLKAHIMQQFGYEPDRHGHLKKTVTKEDGTVKHYRFKFQPKALRKEVRITIDHTYGPPQNEWVRVWSAYYGNIAIGQDGKLQIAQQN